MTQSISLPLAAIVMASSLAAGQGTGQFVFHRESVLGTSLELRVAADTRTTAGKAEARALAEIDRESKVLSGYDPGSEFSRWMRSRGEGVRVSEDLFEVLSRFDRYRALTSGALDASAEAVTEVWKSAAASHRLPSLAEIDAAIAAARGPNWSLDTVRRTATHLTDTPLILNSFTKSYIAGKAADAVLALPGVTAVVVNIGGDLVARGPRTETVDIADPQNDAENAEPIARIEVRDRAVATSGNYRRGVTVGGRFYSHIVDPRTGQPVDHILSSTVVAADPADAGALATAFSVLTPEESARVAAAIPGVEYLLIGRGGKRIASAGWNRLATAFVPAMEAPAPQATPGEWDPEYDLTVSLELARIEGARARRPYVAVWVEDKDGYPVRTLGLWYQKPRWLPELRAWNRDDRKRLAAEHRELAPSVSSATRPPGKYTLKWDGKDNAGKPVMAGTYTIIIEAAREHGTYQIMRQEMEFKGTPKEIDLKGGTEISAASLNYGRKAH
jgi:thiamine biosynthesis lipoprotein ApbE